MKTISYFLIISTLWLCSCASMPTKNDKEEKDPINEEFIPYVDRFIELSDGKITKRNLYYTYIEFDDLEDTIVGTCLVLPWFKEIKIDRDWWSTKTEIEREHLMFHELGHCLLLRPHTAHTNKKGIIYFIERLLFKLGLIEKKEYLEDGCPYSYMHPYTVNKICIKKHYSHYIRELFNHDEDFEVKKRGM